MNVSTTLPQKLHSETSKTNQLAPDQLDFPLFWQSQHVTCIQAGLIFNHVTRLCKEPIYYIFVVLFTTINCSLTLTCSVERSPFWCSSPSWTHIACQSDINWVTEKYFLIDDHFTSKLTFSLSILYSCTASTPLHPEMHVIMKLTHLTKFLHTKWMFIY